MTDYEKKLQEYAQKVAIGKELVQDDWWHCADDRSKVLSEYIDRYLMLIGDLVFSEITNKE